MESAPGDPCVQACPNCAALVDISDQEPLSKFHCPLCGTAMRANRQYNHFAIVESVGQGGMGTVYKALDRNLNRMVALKLLRRELSADESYILKLEEEARITASINHPYVVKVFSFGSDHGQYYIAMELVDKGTLDDLMQLQNRIAELQVLQVGLQVASGLQAAHEAGLIHRDVKPGNILFADARTAKITDFGLALLAEHEADARGEIWGTPYYIAPEKLNNEPEDFRSDIYSLGGTLFHAVAGRPPFEAESASLVALKHLKSRAVSLQAFAPDVSSETAYVINRMLHKDPNQRYASYGELIDHFKYAIDTLTANTSKPRVARERVVVESEQQNNVAGILTLVLLALLLVGGGLAFFYRDRLKGGDNATPPPAAANALPGDAKTTVEAAYEDARHQIVTGQYADAQESLKNFLQRTDVTQPITNWAQLHYGMTQLLNQQSADSRTTFTNLQRAGPYSNLPNDKALATFFPETARHLAESKLIPGEAIKLWNKNSFENLSLLLFGLKDWEQGEFADASKFFEAYLSGKPAAPYAWVNDYAPIARKCIHDYNLYAPLQTRKLAGKEPPDKLQADFARARGQLETTGMIVEAFFSAEASLINGQPPTGAAQVTPQPTPAPGDNAVAAATPKPTPTPTATPNVAKDVHDAETVRWQTARESYERMVAVNRYPEAQAVLDHVKFEDPDYRKAQEILRTRVGRLIAFKRMLINDINAHGGYPKPVTSRRGVSYPRGLQLAGGDSVEAGTPYGTITVPWTDFAPQVVLSIAAYYTDATASPTEAADRRWLAANYALESGQKSEATSLATRAAQVKPAYQSELAQFTTNIGSSAPLPPRLQTP